jgi:hypothetical protein
MLQPLLGMAGSSIRLQQLDLLADWDWLAAPSIWIHKVMWDMHMGS